MPNKKKESLIVVMLVVALLALAGVVAFPSHGQTGATQDGRPRVVSETAKADAATEVANAATKDATSATDAKSNAPTALAPSATGSTAGSASAISSTGPVAANFVAAARQNIALRSDLDWVFGGKQQRGWSIYEPLIARTLAVETGAESNEFALGVSRWQSSLGLTASGVIDRDSWMGMVGVWQSRRLKDHAYPTPDQLVTAAPSECYDPARPAELRQVERTTYAAYKRMIVAAAADKSLGLQLNADGNLADSEKFLKIVSAFRSREYQDNLRRQQPGAGRAALAVNSPHFTGRALDLYVGGYDPVSTKDDNRAMQTQTKVYKWLVSNADKFGFRPYYYEPWHWEYVGN
jgi:D-alanyl-D-alanine carboxypeptidase